MRPFGRRIRDSANGQTTFLAPAAKIVGTVTGKGAFIFCGTVEGDCDIDGPVTVAAGGHWSGTLRATDVIIAGKVDGDVIAAERVEIAGSAHVTGSLSGNSIAVAEGAVIEGEIKVTSGRGPTQFAEKRGQVSDRDKRQQAGDHEKHQHVAGRDTHQQVAGHHHAAER